MITIISFYCLQNIRHYNFKPSSFCGNLYFAPDNKSLEMDALLGVAADIFVHDCRLTTSNNHDKSFDTKQVAFEDGFTAENELETYQIFENMWNYSLLKLK